MEINTGAHRAPWSPPPSADNSNSSSADINNTSTETYATKLKGNPRPKELAARSAKKAFIHGVDTKIIRSSAIVNGRKAIFLSNEEDDFMAAPFQYALVGKFSHGYPTMTRLHAKFVALGINKGFKIDEATTEIDNPVVARICVEINVLDKLQPDIPIQIEGHTRFCKVQYEGIPEYCKICRHRGHSIASCYLRKAQEDVGNDKIEEDAIENNEFQEKGDLRDRLDKIRVKRPIVVPAEGSTSLSSMVAAKLPATSMLVKKANKDVLIPLENINLIGRMIWFFMKGNKEKQDCPTQNHDGQKTTHDSRKFVGANLGKNKSGKLGSRLRDEYTEDDEDGAIQPLTLGQDVVAPINGELEDSGESENSEDMWHEVSSRKHRRSTSLDDSANKRKGTSTAMNRMNTTNDTDYTNIEDDNSDDEVEVLKMFQVDIPDSSAYNYSTPRLIRLCISKNAWMTFGLIDKTKGKLKVRNNLVDELHVKLKWIRRNENSSGRQRSFAIKRGWHDSLKKSKKCRETIACSRYLRMKGSW
ncbi:hypothetical protein BUALT_Bualt07G0033000 [Buddleja alternifolia]|uniref:DUF4283 domain-containing protein n=1 Tax=Buddleja alternifolia TaxID=168488 RepID=A0AAV6XFK2_9LAMI|nr:hypothetical protein BUALT_Bualt07G0033000 [Buddleja alternifolia]